MPPTRRPLGLAGVLVHCKEIAQRLSAAGGRDQPNGGAHHVRSSSGKELTQRVVQKHALRVDAQLGLDAVKAGDVRAESGPHMLQDTWDVAVLLRPVGQRLRQRQPVEGDLAGEALPEGGVTRAEDLDVAGVTRPIGRREQAVAIFVSRRPPSLRNQGEAPSTRQCSCSPQRWSTVPICTHRCWQHLSSSFNSRRQPQPRSAGVHSARPLHPAASGCGEVRMTSSTGTHRERSAHPPSACCFGWSTPWPDATWPPQTGGRRPRNDHGEGTSRAHYRSASAGGARQNVPPEPTTLLTAISPPYTWGTTSRASRGCSPGCTAPRRGQAVRRERLPRSQCQIYSHRILNGRIHVLPIFALCYLDDRAALLLDAA